MDIADRAPEGLASGGRRNSTACGTFYNEPLDGKWVLTVTDTDRNGITGTLTAWSITVTPLTESAAASSETAAAVDLALLAWVDLDSSNDEDTDPLPTQAADELALMLFE